MDADSCMLLKCPADPAGFIKKRCYRCRLLGWCCCLFHTSWSWIPTLQASHQSRCHQMTASGFWSGQVAHGSRADWDEEPVDESRSHSRWPCCLHTVAASCWTFCDAHRDELVFWRPSETKITFLDGVSSCSWSKERIADGCWWHLALVLIDVEVVGMLGWRIQCWVCPSTPQRWRGPHHMLVVWSWCWWVLLAWSSAPAPAPAVLAVAVLAVVVAVVAVAVVVDVVAVVVAMFACVCLCLFMRVFVCLCLFVFVCVCLRLFMYDYVCLCLSLLLHTWLCWCLSLSGARPWCAGSTRGSLLRYHVQITGAIHGWFTPLMPCSSWLLARCTSMPKGPDDLGRCTRCADIDAHMMWEVCTH